MNFFIYSAFLFITLPVFASGQEEFSGVEFLPVRKALKSMVLVSAFEGNGNYSQGSGFITKDGAGNVGVLTGFHLINEIITNQGGNFIFVQNHEGRFFPVREVTNISPEDNLIFLTVKGDLTNKDGSPPLPLSLEGMSRDTIKQQNRPPRLNVVLQNPDELFYISRPPFYSNAWFNEYKVREKIFLPDRTDFIVDTLAENIIESVLGASLIINKKGEVVSIAFRGSGHTLFGVPLRNLRTFLSLPKNRSVFIKGSIAAAKKSLYDKALAGNPKAQYELVSHSEESLEGFRAFTHSIGVTDLSRINNIYQTLLEGSVGWEPELYFKHLMYNKKLGNKERKKKLSALAESASMKFLIEKEHPHFEYILGWLYFLQGDNKKAEFFLNKSGKKGYIPGLVQKAVVNTVHHITVLSTMAERNYPPAQEILDYLNRWEANSELLTNHLMSRLAGKTSQILNMTKIEDKEYLKTRVHEEYFQNTLQGLFESIAFLKRRAKSGCLFAQRIVHNNFLQHYTKDLIPSQQSASPKDPAENCKKAF